MSENLLMKIMSWITVIFFGSIVLRVLLYVGYKVVTREAFGPTDVVVVFIGLIAAWILSVKLRTFVGAKKNQIEKSE